MKLYFDRFGRGDSWAEISLELAVKHCERFGLYFVVENQDQHDLLLAMSILEGVPITVDVSLDRGDNYMGWPVRIQ